MRKYIGVYGKFNVERADGGSGLGQRHEQCTYFVLDLNHDPHAVYALRAYASACHHSLPALARDLRYAAANMDLQRDKKSVVKPGVPIWPHPLFKDKT